ncbi:MAG: hypothetical protein EOO52_13085 [Gammaproteobacteria bacterium]|nr:MAG: hypothetical protein EOO52_13085 [Gammaproteobacteria bacterium]
MRIYFSSLILPKKAAKRIQKHFTPDYQIFEPMALSHAQFIVAYMLGYEDWHELDQITKSGKYSASLLDEYASADEQQKRIDYQVARLGRLQPQTEPLIKQMVLQFRVSAGNPLSENFAEDGYRTNSLFYWEPWGEEPEWRFIPSRRSEEVRDLLYELLNLWGGGEITLGDYEAKLEPLIESQPENIIPYLYLITAYGEDAGYWEDIAPFLEKLEAIILNSIPPSYPKRGKVPPLIWGTIDNRDYLRSIYCLGVGFYAINNFKKAKKWLLFLRRCCAVRLGNEKEFLIDLRQPNPEGDLHLLEPNEIFDRYYDPVSGKRLET